MRDQKWLEQIFSTVLKQYFSDVQMHNPLRIEWGRKARSRLGSLNYDPAANTAIIRISKLFTDEVIPVNVVKATIVHELCHYSHGWHNGKATKYSYPHRGGVIQAEFAERGLEKLYDEQQQWLQKNWLKVVQKHYPKQQFRALRRP